MAMSYCAAYCVKPMPMSSLQSVDDIKFICLETEGYDECDCGGDTGRCPFHRKESK